MKKINFGRSSFIGLLIAAICFAQGAMGQEIISDSAMDSNGLQYVEGQVDCGPSCGTMNPCYTGCCEYGLLPFVRDVAHVALTPVYLVASVLSSGVYADCGCAPRVPRTWNDNCDQCGNWVGNTGGCSTCGATAAGYGERIVTEPLTTDSEVVPVNPMPERAIPQKLNKNKNEALPPKATFSTEPRKSGAMIPMTSGPVKVAVRAPMPNSSNYRGYSRNNQRGVQLVQQTSQPGLRPVSANTQSYFVRPNNQQMNTYYK